MKSLVHQQHERMSYAMKSNFYNVCTLKCASITNVSLEHYMEVLLDNNIKQAESEKKIFFEQLYWVVFQLFIQKKYKWQNNTFWCDIISTKKHDSGGLRWAKY